MKGVFVIKSIVFFSLSFFISCSAILLAGQESPKNLEEKSRLTIEESRTRVFLFSVYLTIDHLIEKEGELHGVYKIRVPSSSSDNEEGKSLFELETPLEDLLLSGGTLTGKGVSSNPKHPERVIICEFLPDKKLKGQGEVHMTIDTQKRVIRFRSKYQYRYPEK